MEYFNIKIQDIKIHLEETAYCQVDLKNDLRLLDYCVNLKELNDKALAFLSKPHSNTSDFEKDKRELLKEFIKLK